MESKLSAAVGGEPTKDQIKHVYVVDDDAGFRNSLDLLLTLESWNVRCFESGAKLLSIIDELPPGVVLLDLRMPEQSGLDILKQHKDLFGASPIIMMTGHGDIQVAVQALKLGAADFIEKPFVASELLDSMIEAYLLIRQNAERIFAEERIAKLSRRELQVLKDLVEGGSNKTIAASLNLSPRTVEMHRARLLKKLNVSNTSEAVHLASVAHIGSISKETIG